jgi:hypothetical protein
VLLRWPPSRSPVRSAQADSVRDSPEQTVTWLEADKSEEQLAHSDYDGRMGCWSASSEAARQPFLKILSGLQHRTTDLYVGKWFNDEVVAA